MSEWKSMSMGGLGGRVIRKAIELSYGSRREGREWAHFLATPPPHNMLQPTASHDTFYAQALIAAAERGR